ncbi:hypothetical protein [Piscinibacter sp.]|uniref:hypothetical protein n=1 Tax=Piscinibacter sp. TaxID=1903157 RepID=UPI0039E51F01
MKFMRIGVLAGFIAVVVVTVYALIDRSSKPADVLALKKDAPTSQANLSLVPEKFAQDPVQRSADSQAVPPVNRSDKATRFADFENSADLRIFVEKMKRSAEMGAGLYVSTALLDCLAIRTDLLAPENKAKHHEVLLDQSERGRQRLADWQFIEGRCAGFSEAELKLDEWSFQTQAAKSKDPMLQLRSKMMNSSARTPQTYMDMLAQLMASGEPLLQRQVPEILQLIEHIRGKISLDGVPYGGLSAPEYWLAWQAGACIANGNCASRPPSIKQRCAFEGECFNSELDAIRADAGSEARFHEVQRVAARLADLIARGDHRPLTQ